MFTPKEKQQSDSYRLCTLRIQFIAAQAIEKCVYKSLEKTGVFIAAQAIEKKDIKQRKGGSWFIAAQAIEKTRISLQ